MKKNKYNKPLLYMALTASLLMGSRINAYATDNTDNQTLSVQRQQEFQTTEEHADGSEYFETSIEQDGKIYTISNIITEVVREETVEGEYIFYDSPAFIDTNKVEKPSEMIEQNGNEYILKEVELQPARIEDRTQYVESEVVINGIEWLNNVPETSEITITDNATGQELTTTMPFIKVKSQNEKWSDDFSFPITISGYDADYFMLGETRVSKTDDLVNYKEAFLSYLSLPSNKYKITKIDWNGESYINDGVMCRTATAFGQKLTYDITAIYGGEAALPAADGQRYHCTYVNSSQPDSKIYTIKAIAHYEDTSTQTSEEQGLLQNLIEWLRANPIAAFGIGTITLIAFILFILFISSKKKDKKEDDSKKVDIIDLK